MVEIERDIEEELGVDSLVPRRSNNNKNGTDTHYNHTVFDSQQCPIDGLPVETFEGEEDGVEQGSETLNGLSRMEFQVVSDGLLAESIIVEDDSTPKSSLETDLESLEIQKDESTGIYSAATAKTSKSNGDQSVAVNGDSNGTMKLDESAALEGFKEDSLGVDVERVLKKQQTHDLFCPNCNSCITKRVILRPRKRKIQEISPIEDTEPSPQQPVQDLSPQEPEVVEDPSGDAFECLSCFSIFIPIGRCLQIIGLGGLKGTVQDPSQLTKSDAPASMPVTDPGTGEDRHLGVDPVEEQSPLHSQPDLYPGQGGKPSSLPPTQQDTSMAVNPDTNLQPTTVDSMASPIGKTLPTKPEADGVNDISGTAITERVTVGKQGGLLIRIDRTEAPDVPGTLVPPKDVAGIENEDPAKVVAAAITENKVTVGGQGGLLIRIDRTEAPVVPSPPKKDVAGIANVDPVVQNQDETVITVKIPTDTSAETEPLPLAGSDTSAAPSAIPAAVAATDGGDPQIDIIKSMVYGGMLEAIASLSVVTSAAGADAKTLNIVALGAANMFGGLFVLAHNLRVLKHETSEERYKEVLGRPGHFTLHSVVAVLSYLVFGLIPLVIYGFTFRESDNRDYKLIAVAMASLVCIIILALAKSYTRSPSTPKDYMKTLVYYISLWIMVCGVSYVAGDLLDLLLQKLGLFESSSTVAMPVGEFRPVKMPWASI